VVTTLDLTDLTAHLSAVGLARQKSSEELRIVDGFPRTASCKIRKVDLRAWLRSESDHATTHDPARSR
jgi:non-ribosomal peptide synthetase component E (peptide arylation enzyme)